jgi:hypothetical protein
MVRARRRAPIGGVGALRRRVLLFASNAHAGIAGEAA